MVKRIIAGTDGSKPATRAVAWAASLAQQLNAELVLVHAFEIDPAKLPGGYAVLPEDGLDRLREESRLQLEGQWSAPAGVAGARHRTLLIDGNATGVLIHAAQEEQADLLVVGHRGGVASRNSCWEASPSSLHSTPPFL